MLYAPSNLFESVRVVLFDAVGTLMLPDPQVAEVYQFVGGRHGHTLSEPEVHSRFKAAFRTHFGSRGEVSEELEKAAWRQVVADVFREAADPEPIFADLWSHFAQGNHWQIVPAARECLERANVRGYRTGIASNFDERLRSICAYHELPVASDCMFISSEVGFAKPHAGFFRHVEAAVACRPEQILLVGDDERNDAAGAQAAGWKSYLLRDEPGPACEGGVGSWATLMRELDRLSASEPGPTHRQ